MNWQLAPGDRIHLIFRVVTVAALITAFAQVTLGGVVRVTDSGLGCPDWPLCHGRIIPPFELTTLIEYSHRLAASVLGLLVVVVAILAWLFYRWSHWLLASSVLGLALVVTAAVLGGVTVLTELAWWVVLFHLGTAELLVACMVVVSMTGWNVTRRWKGRAFARTETDDLNPLVLAALIGLFLLILSGSYMVGYGAGSSCATWPLCRGSLISDGTASAIHMGHRFLAAAVGALIVATALSAWSRRLERPKLGWAGLSLVGILAAQIIAGAGTVWSGFAPELKAIHLSLATLMWVALVFLATLVYSPNRLEAFVSTVVGHRPA